MENYIEGNKAAWEEAFDKRDASWGADITERIQKEDYPFFEKEMVDVVKEVLTKNKRKTKYDLEEIQRERMLSLEKIFNGVI